MLRANDVQKIVAPLEAKINELVAQSSMQSPSSMAVVSHKLDRVMLEMAGLRNTLNKIVKTLHMSAAEALVEYEADETGGIFTAKPREFGNMQPAEALMGGAGEKLDAALKRAREAQHANEERVPVGEGPVTSPFSDDIPPIVSPLADMSDVEEEPSDLPGDKPDTDDVMHDEDEPEAEGVKE